MLVHFEEQLEAFEAEARMVKTQGDAERLCADFRRFKLTYPDPVIRVRIAMRFAKALDPLRFKVRQ